MRNNNFREQGSTYNEEKYGVNSSDFKDAGLQQEYERLKGNKISSGVGVNKTTMIILAGVGVLAILIIVVLVILFSGMGSDSSNGVPDINKIKEGRYVDPTAGLFPDEGYSPDMIQSLRENGFTADEIEKMERNGDDPEKQLAIKKEKERLKLQKEYHYLIDNVTNKEIKDFVSNTIYVNPKVEAPKLKTNKRGEFKEPVGVEIRENVDYWKVPLHGHQAFLKLKLKSGEVVFYQCSISRYETLRDSGNIVIVYNRIEADGKSFIQNIRESKVETPGLN